MKTTDKVRLQKLVANFGKYSRREFEKFISEGRVKVNGKVAKLGDQATINDNITLDGKKINLNTKYDYYLVNKPKGFISSRVDEKGKQVISLIDNYKERNLFTVGRLDVNTTGLIIVTNDGALAEKVNRPNSNKRKEYLAWLDKPINKKQLIELSKGVELDDGYLTKPLKKIKIIDSKDKTKKDAPQMVKLVLTEGKKNQVKRMFEAVGSKVINLKRTKIEDLTLEGIETGSYKKLSKTEIYGRLNIKV
jgi:pseudouridine synthase